LATIQEEEFTPRRKNVKYY